MTREELLEKVESEEMWLTYYPPSDSMVYTDSENYYNHDGQKLRDIDDYEDYELEDCDCEFDYL